MRRVALTVDLDPAAAYHEIHGLPPPPPGSAANFTRAALPRFLSLFARLGARATFFVVGEDLASAEVAALLQQAARAGHEVANHTHTHPYHFLALPPDRRAQEIDRAHEAIAQRVGSAPEGFRAPGYFIDAETLALLAARGYRYDASMFPSWPYYAAKAAAMAGMFLRGRPSRARLHDPRLLLAPADPYRPDPARPHRRGSSPVVELPAASLAAGVPALGTWIALLPPVVAGWAARPYAGRDFTTVEFHGIDLVDAADGGLGPLAPHQPGTTVPVDRRLAACERFLRELTRGATPLPLRECASSLV